VGCLGVWPQAVWAEARDGLFRGVATGCLDRGWRWVV